MAKWLAWLEGKLGGGKSGEKRVRTFQWLVILGLVGVSLMIMNSYLNIEPVEQESSRMLTTSEDQAVFGPKEPEDNPFTAYERKYESKLKEILEKIIGVGNVDVMVTIDATEESVVYQDTHESSQETNEKDGNGGQRHITSLTQDGKIALYSVSGENKPIILKLIKPQVRGVVIVAAGAENAVVKQMLSEAVQRGLNVSPTRISILPRKTQ